MLYHLRTKFDLNLVEAVGNTLLQEYTLSILPEQVEVVADLHLRPYYGDEADTDGLYYREAKAGTTAFHAYATLYALMRNKRDTLAVRRVIDGDTMSFVLAEFLGLLDSFDFDVKVVYLDRGFFDGKVSPSCKHTKPPTSCRSSSGARRSTRNLLQRYPKYHKSEHQSSRI